MCGKLISWNQRAHSRITRRRSGRMNADILISFQIHVLLMVTNVSCIDVVHLCRKRGTQAGRANKTITEIAFRIMERCSERQLLQETWLKG